MSIDGACVRCGGTHTARQRCPGDGVSSATAGEERTSTQPAEYHGLLMLPAQPTLLAATVTVPHRRSLWRTVGSFVGGLIGTVVLISCLSVAGTYIVQLTERSADVSADLTAVIASIVIGLLFGALLLYVSARLYAKIVFCALAVFLITAGFLMQVFAPVLHQMAAPNIDNDRALTVLITFGGVTLGMRLLLGGLCLRWATRPKALRRLSRWARLLGSAYGVVLGISGVFAMFSLLLINSSSDTTAGVPERAIATTAIAMFSLVPGLILTYHGISASMGEPSGEWRPPVAVAIAAVYGGVLLCGGVVMAAVQPVAAPMPLLHALAAGLPGIGLVALAARGSFRSGQAVMGLTWRQVTLAVAISMTIATTIAIYVEGVGSFGAVLLLLVHNGAFEFARDQDNFWDIVQNSDVILSRNEQFVLNLIVASLIAPLIEEAGKGLGARFMFRPWTTRAQAFVLGAAAGAGFGFLEAMLYGVAGVRQSGPGGWWTIMLVRGGSTSLHVLNTGLVGLAWWYGTFGGQKRRAWLLFGLAVTLHALWNGFAVTLDSRILGLDTLSQHVLTVIAYVIVGVLAAAFVTAIPLIARWVREPAAGPSDEVLEPGQEFTLGMVSE